MFDKHDFVDLDERARQVFRQIVESFIDEGSPVGSRTLSRSFDLSPATIRNVMSDLEHLGLLHAPHVSAGRLPTDMGLRYFVDGILELGELSDTERAALEEDCKDEEVSVDTIYEQASTTLSGLSHSAGLVVAPTQASKPIRHIEFISLAPEKALVVIVSEDGSVENKLIDIAPGTTNDMLREAGNFLSEKLYGRTIGEMHKVIEKEIADRRHEMSDLMTRVIDAGLASKLDDGKLIVRGTAQLLQDPQAREDVENLKDLMEKLESQETVSKLLDEAGNADGVKIYIGSENSIFEGTGHSLILSPYRNSNNNVIGAIGVIGPMRLNYAKIIPSVNYMAEILSRRIRSF
ncbi:MAG: heat-inducible transcriptional repressor HrcA [Pseudomonadota bacterium]